MPAKDDNPQEEPFEFTDRERRLANALALHVAQTYQPQIDGAVNIGKAAGALAAKVGVEVIAGDERIADAVIRRHYRKRLMLEIVEIGVLLAIIALVIVLK